MLSSDSSVLPYLNLALSLRVDYPSDWQIREHATAQASAVAFVSPRETPSDFFAENVVLIVEPIVSSISAEEYVNASMNNMRNGAIQFVGEPQPTQVSGQPRYRVVYTAPLPGQVPLAGKSLLVMFIRGEYGYALTYTAEATHYDTFLARVEKMISTLTLN